MTGAVLQSDAADVSAAGQAAGTAQVRTAARHRPYLYEVDLVRVVTALCVVGVHAAAFTVVFNHSSLGAQLQNAVVDVLHFTREVFLSITAFVLVYGYAHRPFDARRFWRRRGLGVLLPYVAWSFFYVWFSAPHRPFGAWLATATLNTIDGSASYQLYFILLSLEFYLILPVFLWALARVERHPWKLLAGSLALQLGVMYFDYHFVQAGPLAATRFGQFLSVAQGRLLPFYQFYAVIGALGALYLEQVRAFILRHSRAVVAVGALGVAILWGRYFYGVWALGDSTDYATAVFQPSVVLFSGTTALFLYWLGCRWALHRERGERPRGWRFVALLSDASFGVYLVHAFILNNVLSSIAPAFPTVWPAAFRALLVWAIAAAGAVGLSVLFIYLPGFSRLVGRPCAWTGAVAFLRRVAAALRQPFVAALRPVPATALPARRLAGRRAGADRRYRSRE